MKIYNKPFVYDPLSQMIECKSTPHMVAQIEPDEPTVLLIRGWGGLHTTFGIERGRQIQDAFGQRVAELLNEHGVGEEVIRLIYSSKT